MQCQVKARSQLAVAVSAPLKHSPGTAEAWGWSTLLVPPIFPPARPGGRTLRGADPSSRLCPRLQARRGPSERSSARRQRPAPPPRRPARRTSARRQRPAPPPRRPARRAHVLAATQSRHEPHLLEACSELHTKGCAPCDIRGRTRRACMLHTRGRGSRSNRSPPWPHSGTGRNRCGQTLSGTGPRRPCTGRVHAEASQRGLVQ